MSRNLPAKAVLRRTFVEEEEEEEEPAVVSSPCVRLGRRGASRHSADANARCIFSTTSLPANMHAEVFVVVCVTAAAAERTHASTSVREDCAMRLADRSSVGNAPKASMVLARVIRLDAYLSVASRNSCSTSSDAE